MNKIIKYLRKLFKLDCPNCGSHNYKDMGIDMWCKDCNYIGNL